MRRLNAEIPVFLSEIDKDYSLRRVSPLFFRRMREFVLRDGKRIRPFMLVAGCLGYAKRMPGNLFRCAVSAELLNDFILIHDDIIDDSDTRRGKPSLHAMLNRDLKRRKVPGTAGADLSMIIGDVIFALAIRAFLSVKADRRLKEAALDKFIEAALYTGSGEFMELLAAERDISAIRKKEIERIYDYKTAYYSFASPLAAGAVLAGASKGETEKLQAFGLALGRAFQIKDDMTGFVGTRKSAGKPVVSDIRERKKTLLVWYAYRNSGVAERNAVRKIFKKKKISGEDLYYIKNLIIKSGALDDAKREISVLRERALGHLDSSAIKKRIKEALTECAADMLTP